MADNLMVGKNVEGVAGGCQRYCILCGAAENVSVAVRGTVYCVVRLRM